MSAVVIDTNVLLVADGQAPHMSGACKITCIERLERVRSEEQVVLDYGRLILDEYHNGLDPNGKPSPGQAFVKWMLQSYSRIDWVTITPTNPEQTMFSEFPNDAALAAFDPADRKFVAAANAHFEKPPILEAADSKWLGWEAGLLPHGIRLEVLCRNELQAIRQQKTGEA
ncbi:MAG: hypothetical protein WA849_16305 [Candidatus Udaeobacter sp.]